MFYKIKTGITKQIEFECIDPMDISVGYFTVKELEKYYQNFGFSELTLEECKSEHVNFRSNIEVYDEYDFGRINLINTDDLCGLGDKFAIYIKKNLFLIVDLYDKDDSTEKTFNAALKRLDNIKVTFEKVIFVFFQELIYGDTRIMEKYEDIISGYEEQIIDGNHSKELNKQMFITKKELLVLKNYYMQLTDISEGLLSNENDLFDYDALMYIQIFKDKTNRLNENTQMLRDNLTHVEEAYSTAIDIELNTTMKIFTVLTTIFLPLTLITGWFGMNFYNMPELQSRYGYSTVIGVSIIIVLTSVYFCKKKNWI